MKLHAIEFQQQIIRKFDIGFVDLINEQNRAHIILECFPKLSFHNVIANIIDPLIPQLTVTQASHRIILIKPLLRFGRRFDMPCDQRCP